MGAKRALWAAAIVGLLTAVCPARTALGQQQAPSGVGGVADPTLIPTEDTLETTYGLAMGSGARAGATAVSALAYNTSNMAAVSTYHVEAFSQIIPGSKSNGGCKRTSPSLVARAYSVSSSKATHLAERVGFEPTDPGGSMP